nr:MAG TPA: hypothetical protein [Caudoviricetes sp.]
MIKYIIKQKSQAKEQNKTKRKTPRRPLALRFFEL